MKLWRLSVLALLSACGLHLHAESSDSTNAPTGPAFELQVDAPDEVRGILEKHLRLERYRRLPDLSDSERARLLTEAPDNVRALVSTLGFFSPDIAITVKPAGAAGALPLVLVKVVPGKPIIVKSVTLVLAGAMADDKQALARRQAMQDQWSLLPGMRFNQDAWDAAKQQALRLLTNQQFAAGRLMASDAEIDPEGATAQLTIAFDTGPVYRLGKMQVNGIERYDAEFVSRMARLTPGTDYDQTKLVQAQRRLVDSGYFDSAFFALDPNADPNAAAVLAQVVEAPMQKLILGLGASTDSGFRVSAEHTQRVVPWLGWRAVTKISMDQQTKSLGSDIYSRPDENNWRWGGSVLFQNQQTGGFEINSQRVRAGRDQTSDFVDHNYYLQYDRAQTAATDNTLPVIAETISANYGYTLRRFDSLPFPQRGWGMGLETAAGSTLGNQKDLYGRALVRWQGYTPVARDDVPVAIALRSGRISMRVQAGAVFAADDATIPATQLFLTGGDTSVRGYKRYEIGVPLPDGQTAAGRYMVLGSLEWQRPIVSNNLLTDWESSIFIDAGGVANQPADLNDRVGVGFGAGVRWKSPVGPLQIDLAYGVGNKHLHLHMNVGFAF
jgi:translocation and assembly module TamA